jgi:hypothetical protein
VETYRAGSIRSYCILEDLVFLFFSSVKIIYTVMEKVIALKGKQKK